MIVENFVGVSARHSWTASCSFCVFIFKMFVITEHCKYCRYEAATFFSIFQQKAEANRANDVDVKSYIYYILFL